MTSFSGVTFVLFCFVFVFMLSLKPRPLRSIVPRYAGAPIATRVSFFFPFVYLEMSLFPSVICTIAVFSLYGEYVVRDRCRESQGLTTACRRMPERDAKDQGEDSPKQARSCWFALPFRLATSGANLYPPGVWFADVMTSFSGVAFVLFCFVFIFMLSLKSRPFVQFSSTCRRPDSHTCFFFPFVYFEMSLFPSVICTIAAFSLYGEYVVRFPSGWCFLPCDHELDF